MAEVYRAAMIGAEGFSRPVAIKRLHPAISADQAFCRMFIREARLLSRLHHTNIVSVLDFEWDQGGQLFLVLELVDGVDLARLARSGPLPVPAAVHVIAEVLRALAHAHEHQIVHRDVTPHNVLISWTGQVKLSDFGLAKAIMGSQVGSGGVIKGKVSYLSPDQLQGLDLDGRADLFSVGVMLYELVTGRTPFAGGRPSQQTMAESIARMLTATIVPPRDLRPEVPEALDDAIMRLLERERERRFASAQEALDALALPGRGVELLVALLAERFPDRDASSQDAHLERGSTHGGSSGYKDDAGPAAMRHIRGRRPPAAGARGGGPDRQMPPGRTGTRTARRWRRFAAVGALALVVMASLLARRPGSQPGNLSHEVEADAASGAVLGVAPDLVPWVAPDITIDVARGTRAMDASARMEPSRAARTPDGGAPRPARHPHAGPADIQPDTSTSIVRSTDRWSGRVEPLPPDGGPVLSRSLPDAAPAAPEPKAAPRPSGAAPGQTPEERGSRDDAWHLVEPEPEIDWELPMTTAERR